MDQVERLPRAEDLLSTGWRDSFLLALTFTGRTLRSAFEDFVGVPMSRLRLLVTMHASGELSQADLQRHMEVDGATITRQVKLMEAEGLLQRRADPKDNRFTLVALTPAGRDLVQSLVRRGLEFEQLAVRNIDQAQLSSAIELLARMRANIQAATGTDLCRPGETGDA